MTTAGASVPDVLRERASLQPNDIAVTFLDYDQDWAGVEQSLTWSQLYRRAGTVAAELRARAAVGERAVIVAPQGLDYVVAFLGALQAGLIAVPLSVPTPGAHDERITSVLADTAPAVVLTTSSVADAVAPHLDGRTSSCAVDRLDWDAPANPRHEPGPEVAYLQYTSGSTRRPAGVMITHHNLVANVRDVLDNYFDPYGRVAPPDTTVVSWVPLYHDMGLFIGLCAPILMGLRTVLFSPMSFLQRPARWMQLLASHPRTFSPTPNFAFELAVKRTSDEDMAGLGLDGVLAIIAGGERVQPATLRRFADRFAPWGLSESVLRPSYGLAEATVYVATGGSGRSPTVVRFDPGALAAGYARRVDDGAGLALVGYGTPTSPAVRIVDPDTDVECPASTIGEIWVHGANVAAGYWHEPAENAAVFGARLAGSAAPLGPWLRTGDLGAFSDGELFIVGRRKDVLIVYGRNHYPDDIEATVSERTGGRAVAIAVPADGRETLVVIVEVKTRPPVDVARLRVLVRDLTAAVATTHGLHVADLVPVAPGSLPITTSGKIRRGACLEQYRRHGFTRLGP